MTGGVAEAQSVSEAGTASRRQQIIEAAKRRVAQSGFHGASMHEICAEAGMSPGAVYRYFRSKDEIIAAIAEDEQARNAALFGSASEGGFHARMLHIGRMFLRDMAEPGRVALMAEIMAESLRNPEVARLFQAAEGSCRQMFANMLQDALAMGEVELPVDFDAAITCVMAAGEGLAFRMATDPPLTPERAEPMLKALAGGLFPPMRPDRHPAVAGAAVADSLLKDVGPAIQL